MATAKRHRRRDDSGVIACLRDGVLRRVLSMLPGRVRGGAAKHLLFALVHRQWARCGVPTRSRMSLKGRSLAQIRWISAQDSAVRPNFARVASTVDLGQALGDAIVDADELAVAGLSPFTRVRAVETLFRRCAGRPATSLLCAYRYSVDRAVHSREAVMARHRQRIDPDYAAAVINSPTVNDAFQLVMHAGHDATCQVHLRETISHEEFWCQYSFRSMPRAGERPRHYYCDIGPRVDVLSFLVAEGVLDVADGDVSRVVDAHMESMAGNDPTELLDYAAELEGVLDGAAEASRKRQERLRTWRTATWACGAVPPNLRLLLPTPMTVVTALQTMHRVRQRFPGSLPLVAERLVGHLPNTTSPSDMLRVFVVGFHTAALQSHRLWAGVRLTPAVQAQLVGALLHALLCDPNLLLLASSEWRCLKARLRGGAIRTVRRARATLRLIHCQAFVGGILDHYSAVDAVTRLFLLPNPWTLAVLSDVPIATATVRRWWAAQDDRGVAEKHLLEALQAALRTGARRVFAALSTFGQELPPPSRPPCFVLNAPPLLRFVSRFGGPSLSGRTTAVQTVFRMVRGKGQVGLQLDQWQSLLSNMHPATLLALEKECVRLPETVASRGMWMPTPSSVEVARAVLDLLSVDRWEPARFRYIRMHAATEPMLRAILDHPSAVPWSRQGEPWSSDWAGLSDVFRHVVKPLAIRGNLRLLRLLHERCPNFIRRKMCFIARTARVRGRPEVVRWVLELSRRRRRSSVLPGWVIICQAWLLKRDGSTAMATASAL